MTQPNHSHQQDSGFALLRVGESALVVPRDDIRILEMTIDIDCNDPPSRGVGWIAFGSQRLPVFCPSPDLDWMEHVADSRPVCAVVAAGQQLFGLLCSEAGLIGADEIAFHDMPPAMAAPGSPVLRLAVYQGTPACVSSAEALLADIGAALVRSTMASEGTS